MNLLLPLRCIAVALVYSAAVCHAQSLRIETGTRPAEWSVWEGANKVLVWSFDPAKFKPYVRELLTTTGENLLRDAPYDHLHHHALMYGIRVNGLNFWEETPGNGVQKVVQSPPPEVVRDSAGQSHVRITQVIHWVRPDDAFLPDTAPAALLVERRTLQLSAQPAEQETALDWTSEFEVGRQTNVVTLTGANYHGLGVRFRQDLDPFAVHFVAGRSIDLSNNRQDLSAAPWAGVTFDQPGHAATLVIVGHPANGGGDPVFFSMKTPFAYLAATQGLDKQPLVYKAGDKFTLRYLVLLYPDARKAAALDESARAWRKSSQP